MSLRPLRFALLFIVGLPAHLPMAAMSAPRATRPSRGASAATARIRQADPLHKWNGSGYQGYCDAKPLAALWRGTPSEAKSMAGYMLLGGGRKLVGRTLDGARRRATTPSRGACTFGEAGFQPRDAAALGRIWRVSPQQARARAERKIAWGATDYLRSLLRGRGR